MQMRRRRPTQQRPLPTRLHGRGVPRLAARRPVTDPVDAAMLDEERARAHPPHDLAGRHARVEQLPASHDAVPFPASVARISWSVLPWRRIPTPRQDTRRIRPRRGYPVAVLAPWRSGYAAACKAVYTGSIPVGALSLRSRHSDASTPVARIAAIAGSEISGPILPTNSAAASFAPMKIRSAASAVLR